MSIDNIMKLVADNFQATTYSAAEKLRAAIEQALAMQPEQGPEAHGATHRQPITGGLYKQIGGVWHVWSRIADEPKSWIKSPGTHASGLEKIDAAPQHPGYAGVTVWLGDKTVTQVVSEQQIKYELGDTLTHTAQKCLYLLTIHKGN